MRIEKVLLLIAVALLIGGLALPEDAFARGGRGGGRGGKGGGRGKYKDKGGREVDRPALIEMAETDMRNLDREKRFQAGRTAGLEAVLGLKREAVLGRHRRMGEDARNQLDSRLDVPR